MKDSCSSVSKLLEKYFDQEVTGKEKSLVEEHLLGCSTCQDTMRWMAKLREMVKNPVEEAVTKENLEWVWQKVEKEIRLEKKSTRWEWLRSWLDISPFFKRKVWIPASAAMVILILMTAPLLFKKSPSYPVPSVVEFVESPMFNVMVYESEKAEVTVIWLFEGPENELTTS